MIFNQDLRKYIPPSQLDPEYGGDADFVYDHKVYWPALCKITEERRAAMKARWVKAGSKIGEYEEYLRGGDHLPLVDYQAGLEEAVSVSTHSSQLPPKKVGE